MMTKIHYTCGNILDCFENMVWAKNVDGVWVVNQSIKLDNELAFMCWLN